jgi:hypothetical protein
MAASMKSGVRGFMKRYTWRQLEPTQGNYNLSEIQSDLAWCQSYGKKLIVMIEDKTFVFEKPGPGYLDQYEIRNRVGGFTLARWNSYVISRMNALTKALGNRFDSSNALEGVIIGEETAPSIDNTSLNANGYTAAKYRDAYISMLGSAAASFPTTRIFWYMNYFPGNQDYIGSVLTAVAPKGVVMGGPDVAPDDGSLNSMVYPYYTKFQGKMPLFGQVEGRCYAHEHLTSGYSTKYWTMPELFRFARDELHVDYVFWVRQPKPSPSDSYAFPDALPVIGTNETFNQ